jgi:hypothetical protein
MYRVHYWISNLTFHVSKRKSGEVKFEIRDVRGEMGYKWWVSA